MAKLGKGVLSIALDERQQIEIILDLVISIVDVVFIVIVLQTPLKKFVVALANVEYAIVIRKDQFFQVWVSSWPLLKLKLINEDFGAKKLVHLDTFAHQLADVVSEEESGDEVVLVLHDVINHNTHSPHLIIFHGCIYRTAHHIFLVKLIVHPDEDIVFGPVEYWKLLFKEAAILV